MDTSIPNHSNIAQDLIWDAADHGASVVHLQPHHDGYTIRYRTPGGLEDLMPLSRDAFTALDGQLTAHSSPIRDGGRRRVYLERHRSDEIERLHIRYQKLETFGGID